MISSATESSNVLMVPTMLAGASGLALKGSESGTQDPIVCVNGGRSLGAIVCVKVPVTATTKKDVDLLTPMSGSRRGKSFGSDLLYGSNRFEEPKSETVSSCFGSHVEQNLCIGAPLPVAGDLSHSEQNGRFDVDMEDAPRGNSEVRNKGNNVNSDNSDNSGIMGNVLGGNKVDRNGDSTPKKSWKNLFSVPTKTNGQLQYSRPHRTDGKFVVKPPEEAVMEGIDMWKGCLVGQFLDKRLPFPVVRSLVNKLWGKKGDAGYIHD